MLQYRTKGDTVQALKDVSVDIPARSFVSVVGPSGCGKTTLLKVLSGVFRPTAGRVLLDGVSIDKTDVSGKVGYVFQRPLLLPWRTAIDNVLLTIEIARKELPTPERIALARQWLSLTGLRGLKSGCRMNSPGACSSAFRFAGRLLSGRRSF